ncbi:MAG: hypothetical protein M1820_006846 [Bogoriella megaspora]|nr:MAG: hypothetical protein M1820_006846 [Bogoriella megaspora]
MARAFQKLPLEINQAIAGFIEADSDLVAFAFICRETNNAIDADNCSFWRRRFLGCFTGVVGDTNFDMKDRYKERRSILRKGATFKLGGRMLEKQCLGLIQDLLLEAHGTSSGIINEIGLPVCLNFNVVEKFVLNNDLIYGLFKSSHRLPNDKISKKDGRPHPLLTTIQLMLTPFILSPDHLSTTWSADYSQKAVYESPAKQPVITGRNKDRVNVEWLLHVINFFKGHLTREEETTLFESYSDLTRQELPRMWNEQLDNKPKKLPKSWIGTYTFIERGEEYILRRSEPGDKILVDRCSPEEHGEHLPTMEVEYPEESLEWWPKFFEAQLHSHDIPFTKNKANPTTASSCYQPKPMRFEVTGMDIEGYNGSGYTTPLPPQNDIPGWQRFTMMKYFRDEEGRFDHDAMWAYEGVVFPGAQIIAGRWWAPETGTPEEEIYSGPFIMWNVTDPKSSK